MAKHKISVGSRVSLAVADSEEGWPLVVTGIVVFDWEDDYYQKEVNVKLENGEVIRNVPKWLIKETTP